MRRGVRRSLLTLLGLFLAWGSVSWYITKNSRQNFDSVLAAITFGQAKDFFEFEVLNYQEKFYGASAELKLIPNSALIDESVENWEFHLNRTNGPLFIGQQGIELGLARWQLSVSEKHLDKVDDSFWGGLMSNDQSIGSMVINFSESAEVKFEMSNFSGSNWIFDSVAAEGTLDLANSQHEFKIQASGIAYSGKQFSLHFPSASLLIENLGKVSPDNPSDPSGRLTKLSFNADEGALVLAGQPKKRPFIVQSHGSIWANNDTLNSDWQVSTVGGKFVGIGGPKKSGSFRTNLTLQFREFLTSGFWQYLTNQAQVSSLMEQAEWAVEEVETPEQQDFLRALYLDADRVKQSQLDNPLKSLLIAERSQLSASFSFRVGSDEALSQVSLAGGVKGEGEPSLALKGEARINRRILNKRWAALFDKWRRKNMFRGYETEFESDITLRNGRFLLNNIIVPAESLATELSQALADQ